MEKSFWLIIGDRRGGFCKKVDLKVVHINRLRSSNFSLKLQSSFLSLKSQMTFFPPSQFPVVMELFERVESKSKMMSYHQDWQSSSSSFVPAPARTTRCLHSGSKASDASLRAPEASSFYHQRHIGGNWSRCRRLFPTHNPTERLVARPVHRWTSETKWFYVR